MHRPLRLRALLAFLFGGVALAWADITLGEFVLLFGAYLFFDGIGAVFSGRASEHRIARWGFFAEGVVCCALGVLAFTRPFIPLVVLYVIASWGVVTGVLELVAATRLKGSATSGWLLGLAGLSSIFLAMLLMALPQAGSIAVVRVMGAYALGFGALLFLSSLRID